MIEALKNAGRWADGAWTVSPAQTRLQGIPIWKTKQILFLEKWMSDRIREIFGLEKESMAEWKIEEWIGEKEAKNVKQGLETQKKIIVPTPIGWQLKKKETRGKEKLQTEVTRIMIINCRKFSTTQQALAELIENTNSHYVAIAEHRCKQRIPNMCELQLYIPGFQARGLGTPESPGETAWAVRYDVGRSTVELPGATKGRMIAMQIYMVSGKARILIAVYAPDVCKPVSEYVKFCEKLRKMLEKARRITDEVIMVGDWNTSPEIGKMRRELQMMVEEQELVVRYAGYPEEPIPTWKRVNAESCIDYMICTKEVEAKIGSWEVYLWEAVMSDHRPIIVEMEGRLAVKKEWKGGKSIKTKDITQGEKVEYQMQIKELMGWWEGIERMLEERGAPGEIRVNWAAEGFTVCLMTAVAIALPRIKIPKRQQDWWSTECKKLFRELVELNEEWEREEDQDKKEEIGRKRKQKKKEYKRQIKRDKSSGFEECIGKIEEQLGKEPREMAKTISRMIMPKRKQGTVIRNEDREIVTGEEAEKAWAKYAERLYRAPSELDLTKRQKELKELVTRTLQSRERQQGLDDDWTEEEVMAAIKRMKLGKSRGPDPIRGQYIKLGVEELGRHLTRLMNIMWKEEKMARCLAIGRMGILNKPKTEIDPLNPDNWRLLRIPAYIGRIVDRGITGRMTTHFREEAVIPTTQFGFEQGKATVMAALVILMIIEQTKEDCVTLLSVAIDKQKAYDLVWHTGMLAKFILAGVRGRFIRFMAAWYSVAAGMRGEYIYSTGSGVFQGGVHSPTAYNLDAKDGVREIRERRMGWQWKEIYIPALQYADDDQLFARGPKETQTMINAHGRDARDAMAYDSWEKSEVMIVNPRIGEEEPVLLMDGHRLKIVQEMEYLGIGVNNRGTAETHVGKAVDKAKKREVICKMKGLMGKKVAPRVIKIVWQWYIETRLMYGMEAVNVRQTQVEKMQKIQSRVARICTGLSDKVQRDLVIWEAGMVPMGLKLDGQLLKMWGRLLNLQNVAEAVDLVTTRWERYRARENRLKETWCRRLEEAFQSLRLEKYMEGRKLPEKQEWMEIVEKAVKEEQVRQLVETMRKSKMEERQKLVHVEWYRQKPLISRTKNRHIRTVVKIRSGSLALEVDVGRWDGRPRE
jgi:exonuclease III